MTKALGYSNLRATLSGSPILPVLTVDRAEDAVPLATALSRGGVRALEIVLRTPSALDAIRAVHEAELDIALGFGTVRSLKDLESGFAAGARFAVSPGLNPELSEVGSRYTLVPGVATAGEAMTAATQGFQLLKLFPASACGGTALLRALQGPLPDLAFCPTGGINEGNFTDYLSLHNVVCVGGSWLAPKTDIERSDWTAIEERTRRTLAELGSQSPHRCRPIQTRNP